MRRSRLALRDCSRELVRGRRYVIGETLPAGFGLWGVDDILPIALYPATVDGWYAVVDHFHALGDRSQPRSAHRRRAG